MQFYFSRILGGGYKKIWFRWQSANTTARQADSNEGYLLYVLVCIRGRRQKQFLKHPLEKM